MRDAESEAAHEARCATENTIGCGAGFEDAKSKGAFYVENKQGLRSEIKSVTYEK